MKKLRKQIYHSNQESSQKGLRKSIIIWRGAAYLVGALMCLSTPSFSMEQPDEREALWSTLRTQKSLHKIYEIRCDHDSPLSMEDKNFLEYKCAMEGHPIAQIVIAENIFCKSLSFEFSAHVEKRINKDCHGTILSEELKITPIQTTTLSKVATNNEYLMAKALAQRALSGVLDTDEYKVYLPTMISVGLGGLYPYQLFVDKQSLTKEECQEMFLFWKAKYNEAKQLSKEDEVDGKVTFCEKYMTTGRWIECLYENWQDTEFFLLIHRLLNKFNELPQTESPEDCIVPWWHDPDWK